MVRERSTETVVKLLLGLIVLGSIVLMAIGLGSVISGLVFTHNTPVNQTRLHLVGRYVIRGTSHQVIVFRDMQTGQCYMAYEDGGLVVVPPETCKEEGVTDR